MLRKHLRKLYILALFLAVHARKLLLFWISGRQSRLYRVFICPISMFVFIWYQQRYAKKSKLAVPAGKFLNHPYSHVKWAHPLSSLWNIMSTCLWLCLRTVMVTFSVLSYALCCYELLSFLEVTPLSITEFEWTLSTLALACVCLLGCFICCNFQSAHTSA